MNVNKTFLAGNLTRDPELRYTQSGTAYCKFGIAVNEKYTSGGEKREKTVFVNVTAWAKTAELINQYLKKGDPLFIEGRLDFSEWEKDGEKRSALSVTCERFQFIGSKRDSEPTASAHDDGVPF